MRRVRFETATLTMPLLRQAVLLTLLLPLIFTSSHSRADPLPYAQEEALKARVSEVATYVRKQALQGVHILPDEVKELSSWFNGSWRPVKMQDDAAEENLPAQAENTNVKIPVTPTSSTSKTFGFSTNYHHKGFLPTHDTMMMGVDVNHAILPDKLNLTARPFWGQSWHSLRAYYGTEASLDIVKKEDGLPWGKIVVGYVGGEDSLTDHGRGVEAHGDVDLTEGWKFTTGVRQNSADGNSNYMMVKWKLAFQ